MNGVSTLAKAVRDLIAKVPECLDDDLLETLGECQSPIEQELAVGLAYHLRNGDEPIECLVQEPVSVGNKKYRVDFLLSYYDMIFDDGKPVFDWETQLAVECDGWEWHSSKQQIGNDNKRDQDLLICQDLPTIRFTGSEIFNDPMAAAGRALQTLCRLNRHTRENNLLLLEKHKSKSCGTERSEWLGGCA